MPSVQRSDGLTLSDDRARLDLDLITGWLNGSYWAASRDADTIRRSIDGSLPYGVYSAAGQVAFARAVTDQATFCWIADVIVEETHRGHGVGRWMITTILEQLGALGIARFVLATRDAHGVYEGVGFGPLRFPATWMEIDRRANRPNAADVRIRATGG